MDEIINKKTGELIAKVDFETKVIYTFDDESYEVKR